MKDDTNTKAYNNNKNSRVEGKIHKKNTHTRKRRKEKNGLTKEWKKCMLKLHQPSSTCCRLIEISFYLFHNRPNLFINTISIVFRAPMNEMTFHCVRIAINPHHTHDRITNKRNENQMLNKSQRMEC